MSANKKVGGLAGVTAGQTSLCTVGQEGAGLTYRGYDIYDLADNSNFEEVAYLLPLATIHRTTTTINTPRIASTTCQGRSPPLFLLASSVMSHTPELHLTEISHLAWDFPYAFY